MTALTIAALQSRKADVTLYVFEADRHFYALLAEKDLNEDRLHDLFLDGEGWEQYFDSSWYPLAEGKTASEANDKLVSKIRTVHCEDIDKYNLVLLTHGHHIHDNYSCTLQDTLEEAYADCLKWEQIMHEVRGG